MSHPEKSSGSRISTGWPTSSSIASRTERVPLVTVEMMATAVLTLARGGVIRRRTRERCRVFNSVSGAPRVRPRLVGLPTGLGLALVAIAGALALGVPLARADSRSTLEVVSVEHDPRGLLTVTTVVTDLEAVRPGRFTALVDGVPRVALVRSTLESDPLSIVIAIDTSGSMDGEPIASARAAALELIEQLTNRDRVAVITFASQPKVRSTFTTDRAATREVLRSLVAGGDTALYDAVTAGARLIDAEGASSSVLILLSDGQNYGAGSPVSRSQSVSAIEDQGVTVYSFALGDSADVSYLGEISATSGGRLWEVANPGTLAALFSDLGRRLGLASTIEITVPPLPVGEHTLTLRSGTDKNDPGATSRFEVRNEGLLRLEVITPAADDALIAVEASAPVPLKTLSLEADIDGEPVLLSEPDRILLDPWSYRPGLVRVRLRASVDGLPAAEAEVDVSIPRLDPVLDLDRGEAGTGPELVIAGRAQGHGPTTITVAVNGQDLLTTTEQRVRVSLPESGDVTVQLLRGGAPVLSQSFAIEARTAGGVNWPLWLLVAGMAGLAALAAAVRRARGKRLVLLPIASRPSVARDLVHRAPAENRPQSSMTVVVRGSDGRERRRIVIGARPLTIGSSTECDIVLEGDSIRPIHASLVSRGDGEFQLHAIASSPGRLGRGADQDQWVLVHAGEEVRLGDQILVIE